MKNYVILRSYEQGWFDEREGIKNIQNFAVVKYRKSNFDFYSAKYKIYYFYDELLDHTELEEILKKYGYELKNYINNKEDLLKLIFNDTNLKNELNIVLVFENARELYYNYSEASSGSYSDIYNSTNDIKNEVYKFNMERIF